MANKESHQKFLKAINNLNETHQITAPEMYLENFDELKSSYINRYSSPAKKYTHSMLVDEGFESEIKNDSIYYHHGSDTVRFGDHGRVVEHWPSGFKGKHVEFTEYDDDGYVAREDVRVVDPDPAGPIIQPHISTFHYEKIDDRKTLVEIRYRRMTVLKSLHVSPYMISNEENVIDLREKTPIQVS